MIILSAATVIPRSSLKMFTDTLKIRSNNSNNQLLFLLGFRYNSSIRRKNSNSRHRLNLGLRYNNMRSYLKEGALLQATQRLQTIMEVLQPFLPSLATTLLDPMILSPGGGGDFRHAASTSKYGPVVFDDNSSGSNDRPNLGRKWNIHNGSHFRNRINRIYRMLLDDDIRSNNSHNSHNSHRRLKICNSGSLMRQLA